MVCRRADVAHYSALSGQPAIGASSLADRRAGRLLWEQAGLAGIARSRRPDLLHCPHYTHPLLVSALGRLPLAVTLHDATFFTDRQLHTRAKGPFFRTAAKLALRRADVCIVPSQASADQLVEQAGARPDQLRVAHLGVDTTVFRPPTADAVAKVRAGLGLGQDERYLAFLGTIEPRKNVPALIRGWAAAFAGRPDPPALVIAGGAGWDTEVDSAIAAVPDSLRLVRPGYLPLEQLSGYLGGAEVVCYPSLGEGFGLPVLEGMACGSAVLTTRNLALAEVGGDAVAYTGTGPDAIGQALVELLDRAAVAVPNSAEPGWPGLSCSAGRPAPARTCWPISTRSSIAKRAEVTRVSTIVGVVAVSYGSGELCWTPSWTP